MSLFTQKPVRWGVEFGTIFMLKVRPKKTIFVTRYLLILHIYCYG